MAQTSFEEQDWYETPVYYDIIFSQDNELECDFLLEMQARFGVPGKSVLEPACGSGRLVEAMAHRGYRVTGFDQSAAMLAFARARMRAAGLKARLSSGKLEDFELGRTFPLAHCLVSTFKYLLDEASARSHLTCVARHLRPGGIYVLGFHLSDYNDGRCSRERWFGERDGTRVICNIQSWPADRRTRTERLRSRLAVQLGRTRKKQETHWVFRTYDAAQFRRLLRRVPELEHVATYDFTYDLKRARTFDDEQLDCVLILRRRA
jgi:SAM-dependent methyltransferase